jgi:predicted nucleic acid-binding protein
VSAHPGVEVPAALWRKHRIGELSREDAEVLSRAFEADFHGTRSEPPRFAAVAIVAELLERATGLVAAHDLRAYDGVQLACALAARTADPQCAEFACFDGSLRAAASAHDLHPVP